MLNGVSVKRIAYNIGPPVGLVLLTLLCYMQILNNYFLEDDFLWLEETRSLIQDPAFLFKVQPNFRPLFRVYFLLPHIFSGANPAVYYLFAISVQAITCIVLYLLFSRLLKDRLAGFGVAALFAVSNTHSDAIFWLVANCAIFCLLFFAVGILCWLSYRQGRRPVTMYWLSFTCFVFALFSKEDAVTYLILLVMTDVAFNLADGISLKQRVKQYLPFAAVLAIYVIMEVYLQSSPEMRSGSYQPGLFDFNILHSGTNIIEALYYMVLPLKVKDVQPSILLLTLTVVAVLVAGLVVADRKRVLWAFGWSVIAFLPMSFYAWDFYFSIERGSIRRYLYTPSLGAVVLFVLLAAGLYSKAASRGNAVRKAAGTIIIIIFAGVITSSIFNVRDRSNIWRTRSAMVEAEAKALKGLNPEIDTPAGFVLQGLMVSKSFEPYMLRTIYDTSDIRTYETGQELAADKTLKGRYMVVLKDGLMVDYGSVLQVPVMNEGINR